MNYNLLSNCKVTVKDVQLSTLVYKEGSEQPCLSEIVESEDTCLLEGVGGQSKVESGNLKLLNYLRILCSKEWMINEVRSKE